MWKVTCPCKPNRVIQVNLRSLFHCSCGAVWENQDRASSPVMVSRSRRGFELSPGSFDRSSVVDTVTEVAFKTEPM